MNFSGFRYFLRSISPRYMLQGKGGGSTCTSSIVALRVLFLVGLDLEGDLYTIGLARDRIGVLVKPSSR